jgi:hypothetical protein
VAADVADPLLTVDPDTPPSIYTTQKGNRNVSIGAQHRSRTGVSVSIEKG